MTALTLHRQSLPRPLTRFVGRADALVELTDLLAHARLVTLTGPPGCGKTRLAVEVATRPPPGTVTEDDDDPTADPAAGTPAGAVAEATAFVGLDALDPADDDAGDDAVVDAVALALGVVDDASRPLIDAVEAELEDRPTLLVVDNCEHVIVPCAHVVSRLLARCPRLKVLATSREDLGIEGEVVWPVPPLGVPPEDEAGDPRELLVASESGQLLLDRAQPAGRGRPPTVEQARLMTRLCRMLEGIPFHIELAIGQLDDMADLASLTADLADRHLDVLRSTLRIPQPHRSSVEDSIAWSYDLLSPVEQRVLRRLAVFAATFDRDAAEAVAADPGEPPMDVRRAVTALARKSLLQRERGPRHVRYRLLRSTRHFGRAQLDDDEATLVFDRHLHHLTRLADRMHRTVDGPTELQAFLDDAAVSLDDFRQAVTWSMASDQAEMGLRIVTALRWLWIDVGRFPEGRRRIDELLAAAPDAPPARQAAALVTAGTMALFAVDPLDLRRKSEAAAALAKAAGDPEVEGEALVLRGWSDIFLDPPAALEPLERGRRLLVDAGLPFANWGTIGIGLAHGNEGRLHAGAAELRRAVDTEVPPDHWLAPFTLAALGYIEVLLGDFRSADEHSTLAVSETTQDTFEYQAAQWHGLLRTYQGHYDEAAGYFRHAYEGAASDGGVLVPGWLHYGIHLYACGDLDGARRLITQALDYFRLMRWRWFEAQAESFLGAIAARQGDAETARAHRHQAVQAARTSQNPLAVAISHTGLALQLSDEGDDWGARSRISRALRSAVSASYLIGVVDALETYAAVVAARADTAPDVDDALRALAAARAQREQMGYVVFPINRDRVAGVERDLRAAVGDAADEVWEHGRGLPLSEAVWLGMRGRRRRPRWGHGIGSLTEAELLVLELVAAGRTNKQIATELSKSAATVKNQVSSILRKLNLATRAELATFFLRARAEAAGAAERERE
ncbi:MAG TPA: LuxR C-terminal-related transcriptional regulator [Acidimicrobiales bacterium]